MNIMEYDVPWELLCKFYKGELSEKELKNLETWKYASDLNRNIYEEIAEDENFRNILLSDRWNKNKGNWQKLTKKIELPDQKVRLSKKFLLTAAATVASVIVLFGYLILHKQNQINQLASTSGGYTEIFSPRGQRTQVTLPDQTKVWLNAESSIKYAADFNCKVREVFLNGEAFFEVSKNQTKPFLVNATVIKVKVYGTSFNVKAFSHENNIETTLIEGKLSVIPLSEEGNGSNEIFLKPNEKCIYEKNTSNIYNEPEKNSAGQIHKNQTQYIIPDKVMARPRVIIEKNVNPEQEELWKDGKLIFKNESFEVLAVRLERWYDVKIHFENDVIKSYKFTGVFEKETINQAMEALRLSSKKSYRYKIVFRDIYLKI